MSLQFELWRLFVSVTCFAAALALVRFVWMMVETYGGGLFPALCLIVAVALLVAGVGVLFRRAWEFLLYLIITILKLVGGP